MSALTPGLNAGRFISDVFVAHDKVTCLDVQALLRHRRRYDDFVVTVSEQSENFVLLALYHSCSVHRQRKTSFHKPCSRGQIWLPIENGETHVLIRKLSKRQEKVTFYHTHQCSLTVVGLLFIIIGSMIIVFKQSLYVAHMQHIHFYGITLSI